VTAFSAYGFVHDVACIICMFCERYLCVWPFCCYFVCPL